MTSKRKAISLAKRVEWWQKKALTPLGVGHWKITRISVVEEPFGNDVQAAVHPSANYDSCIFEFSHETVNGDPYELDVTIVHEWLHVALRDLAQAQEDAESLMDGDAYDAWSDRIDHEMEGVIERMARLIVDLHSND